MKQSCAGGWVGFPRCVSMPFCGALSHGFIPPPYPSPSRGGGNLPGGFLLGRWVTQYASHVLEGWPQAGVGSFFPLCQSLP